MRLKGSSLRELVSQIDGVDAEVRVVDYSDEEFYLRHLLLQYYYSGNIVQK